LRAASSRWLLKICRSFQISIFFCVVHAGALWMFFTGVCLWVPRASVWESMHDSLNIDEAITQVRPCVYLSRGVWLLIARICLIQVRSKLKVGICEMSGPYAPGLTKCINWLFHSPQKTPYGWEREQDTFETRQGGGHARFVMK